VTVLGDDRTADRVVDYLDRAGMSWIQHQDPSTVDGALATHVRALVVVHPLATGRTSPLCKRIVERFGDLAVVVVHAEPVTEAMARALYRSGVAAVFHWPHDRRAMVRALLRAIDHDPSSTSQRTSDLVVEASVNEVLELHAGELGDISCTVFDGVVLLQGEVDALWKVHEVEDIVSQVDGVDDVISRSILVTGHRVDDRSIRRSLEQVTRAAADIDPSTIAYRVDDGHVTVAGTVADRRELRKLLKVIRYVRGTRSIRNLVVISEGDKGRDRSVAARVSRALGIRFPRHRIDASVFGGMVVLTGRCGSAARKRDVVDLVLAQDGVVKVVDRLRP
jgi:osmotically-inducible protein OsmY